MTEKRVKFPPNTDAMAPDVIPRMIGDLIIARERVKTHLKDINHELAALIIKHNMHGGQS